MVRSPVGPWRGHLAWAQVGRCQHLDKIDADTADELAAMIQQQEGEQ